MGGLGLTELWNFKVGSEVTGLAFGEDGLLGVASRGWCAYILDQNGKLLSKACGDRWMTGASFSSGIFGFVGQDYHAYLFKGSTFWKKVYVGEEHGIAITVLPDGFIACDEKCAYFDFDGNKRWDVKVGRVDGNPAIHKGYVYVADLELYIGHIFRLSNGSKVGNIYCGDPAYGTAVCGNYLALSTYFDLYLYDISDPANPRELWNVGGFDWARSVAFSPDCKYIAVSDTEHQKLKIFNLEGNLVFEKEYETEVREVAWWRDRIAVGLESGEVHVYAVK
jgi:outer membrane protein assembly factor BamB